MRTAEVTDDFLLQARHYHDAYGWSLLPVKGKRPHVRKWQQFQSNAPSRKELDDMFATPGVTGLGVLAGSVSDGLIVRDFDDRDAYHNWAASHPELACECPTVETARGFHVLARSPVVNRIAKLGDGELRGAGLSLLPTSLHPSGMRYEWLNPPAAFIPLIDDPAAVFGSVTNSVTHTDTCNELFGSKGPMPVSVAEAVASSLPNGPGQRNHLIFRLAVWIKHLVPSASPAQLRMIVQDWHTQALPFIRTKDFQTTMTDFVVAWRRVKSSPLSMRAILEEAETMTLPVAARLYPPAQQKLVRACMALQREWGDRPFFLSARKAGEVMGTDHMSAWRALQELQFDGLLRLEENGTLKGRRGSQWRFVEA